MELTLPRRRDSQAPLAIELNPDSALVIIGANGSGKTRFTSAVIRSLGDRAFRVSALDALYTRRTDMSELSESFIRNLSPSIVAQTERTKAPFTVLELLLLQLMNDEMVNLIAYKLARAGGERRELSATRLDRVISLWQEVFPGNKVLIDSGKILFSRGVNVETYSAVRLSDGERAVLYYAAAVLYAPKNGVIFVDSPEMFLHPTLTSSLWNRLQAERADCTFCYTTHDTEFAASRNGAPAIWVRDFDPSKEAWDYDLMPPESKISPELYMTLAGARKPILFIEGDSQRSIDAKLYPLIFPDYTVRSLGSCNKVIESTRTFNDLASFHKLDSFGIVDRDRRDDAEVGYLRAKKIMVPDVAEIENILLLEDIVRTMAQVNGCDPDRVFVKVRKTILSLFRADLHQQALLHTRHRVKRTMEYRVDARVSNIDTLRQHLSDLLVEIDPQAIFDGFCARFTEYENAGDYNSILRVFNQKSMLTSSNVAQLCGYKNKEAYISGILNVLRHESPAADKIRHAVRAILGADTIADEARQPKPKQAAPARHPSGRPSGRNQQWQHRRNKKKRSANR